MLCLKFRSLSSKLRYRNVREQLKAANDEVGALRALAADPSCPSGPLPEPPPIPAPRIPPPQTQSLLDIVHPLPDVTHDQVMESCETEDEYDLKPVCRLARWDRRNKMGIIKGFTKQRVERRLSVSKHIIEKDVELSDHAESDGHSGKEIANLSCNMPHETLLEVVQHCPASRLQQFWQNVPAHALPSVAEIPKDSCG